MRRWILLFVLMMLVAASARAVEPGNERFSHTVYLQPYSKLRQAAELGDAEAQYDLAYLYYKADSDPSINGVAQNDRLAAYWYRKSAMQGHARAQYNMGVLHLHGHGVERDPIEACAWLLQASASGHEGSKSLLEDLQAILNDRQLAAARERSDHLGIVAAPP